MFLAQITVGQPNIPELMAGIEIEQQALLFASNRELRTALLNSNSFCCIFELSLLQIGPKLNTTLNTIQYNNATG